LSAFHRGVNQLDDSCLIVGMNQIPEESSRFAIKGARLQTVHRLQICAPSYNSRSNIPFKRSYASRLLRQSQPFLAGA
jgi:hypothetical protein